MSKQSAIPACIGSSCAKQHRSGLSIASARRGGQPVEYLRSLSVAQNHQQEGGQTAASVSGKGRVDRLGLRRAKATMGNELLHIY